MTQTEQDSRVYDDKVDFRYDPFTSTDESVSQSDESHVIPGSSPYVIQLREVPLDEEPSSVTVTKAGQLDEDLDDSETGVDVVRGDDWAIDDVFTIDTEKMIITGVAGDTLTVTRGYNSTVAAAHNQYEDVDTGTLDSDGTKYEAHDSTTDFVAEGVRIGDIFENDTNAETATITAIISKTNQFDTLYFNGGTGTSNDNTDSWTVKRPRLLISTVDFTEVDVSPSADEFQVHYGTVSVPYKRGLIRFHEDDKDKTVLVDYEKTGHYNWAEHINDLQNRSTGGAGSDKYINEKLICKEGVKNENLAVNAVELDNMADDSVDTDEVVDAAITRPKLSTSTGNQTGSNVATATTVDVFMQDYCFSPNIYANNGWRMEGHQTAAHTDTVGRFAILNDTGTNRDYGVYWRYVTATDKPFIFALRDNYGDIKHLWLSQDPPAEYWGMVEKPENFVPPVIIKDKNGNILNGDYDEIVKFNAGMLFFNEINNKAKKDKKLQCNVLNDAFEFDSDKQLFRPKNLLTV